MKTLFTTFYIVRHGETVWNTQGLLQGHGDSPLTPEGEAQIRELANNLKSVHFDHVFSSDLLRAKRSAEIIALERNLAVNTTQLLRERTFGKYDGKSREKFLTETQDLFKKFQTLSAEQQWKFKYADGMESDEDVITRLLTFLRKAAIVYEGKTILVVCHGGMLRVLLKHLGINVIRGQGTVNNGAYIKLAADGVEFNIQEMQGIQHEA